MSLLGTNLARVFNEREPARRRAAIEELYDPDATLFETERAFTGTGAIIDAVTHLIAALPPTLQFVAVAPEMVNHDLAKLHWRGVLPDGTVVVTGTDIAQLANGRIRAIYVFLDG